eukprot:NODE_22_length_42145_cov_1.310612.p20 type:complete len:278 gc:universal NODE_22_length_42145_cov_1.310612:32195-31362(-)
MEKVDSFLSFAVDGISKEDMQKKLDIDQQEFVTITNQLLKQKKIQMKQIDGVLILTTAKQSKNKLNIDEESVYKVIKSTAKNGLWSKHIKSKTQLHPSKIDKALKKLVDMKLIQTFKHVEYPSRIYYICSSVKPTESATGGPWFTDMELDTAFVEGLTDHILKYIQIKSKSHLTYTVSSFAIMLPNLEQIHQHILKSGITSVDLSQQDIRKLIRLLEYDGKVETVLLDGTEKFMIHKRYQGPNFNVPCSNCPVAEQCSPKGKYSPNNCEYFEKWLSF